MKLVRRILFSEKKEQGGMSRKEGRQIMGKNVNGDKKRGIDEKTNNH